MIEKCYIGLGSNLGDRLGNLIEAAHQIKLIKDTVITRYSSVYETDPWGDEDQPDFFNAVIEIETAIGCCDLLQQLLNIEDYMGRVRERKWGPRVIDLDILLYGNRIIEITELKIPHPLMQERNFVLIPMVELVPNLVHPLLKKTIQSLAEPFQGGHISNKGSFPEN